MAGNDGGRSRQPIGPDQIVATYRYRTGRERDAAAIADRVAILESTGIAAEDTDIGRRIREDHAAAVIDVRRVSDRRDDQGRTADPLWAFRVAYPASNVGAQIPLLLATVFGECASIDGLRLIDLDLPSSFVGGFAGPRFGVDGVRAVTGARGRPLLITMVKPSLGLTPPESAAIVLEAALGGVDGVKDDELLVDQSWSRIRDRVRAHERAATAAFETTGRRAVCFVNVTDRPDRLLRNAHEAIEAGASGIMVDFVAVGVAALGMLVDDPGVAVPILGHLAFSGAMYGGPGGISPHLILGVLPRLAGADVVVYPAPGGSLPLDRPSQHAIADALRRSMGHVRSALPMPGGGMRVEMVADLIAELGTDVVIGAGGAIHRHPMGTRAGAAAFRQAIDAALDQEEVAEAARRHPELAAALEASRLDLLPRHV